MSNLNQFIRNLSSEAYKDFLVDNAQALATSTKSINSLEELRREEIIDGVIPPEEYYEQYVILALASAIIEGIRSEEDLKSYVLIQSLEDLSYMEEFLDQREAEEVTDSQFTNRLINYLATPAYFWSAYAINMVQTRKGAKQMRRICAEDDRSCECCLDYADKGWVSLSDRLPLPGEECTCYRNCRCSVEYR